MIRSTLVTDGSSDGVLTRIIDWTLRESGIRADLKSEWADLRGLRNRPVGLENVIRKAVDLYPCDLLFVHRDAEKETRQSRVNEISDAIRVIGLSPHIAVVPVRMQESWLLCDEKAIRVAAGNPNGAAKLKLPKRTAIERIADPKKMVFKLLKTASGRRGRKLQRFNVESARTQICEQMTDFSLLRDLPSFVAFEADVRTAVNTHHFDRWP